MFRRLSSPSRPREPERARRVLVSKRGRSRSASIGPWPGMEDQNTEKAPGPFIPPPVRSHTHSRPRVFLKLWHRSPGDIPAFAAEPDAPPKPTAPLTEHPVSFAPNEPEEPRGPDTAVRSQRLSRKAAVRLRGSSPSGNRRRADSEGQDRGRSTTPVFAIQAEKLPKSIEVVMKDAVAMKASSDAARTRRLGVAEPSESRTTRRRPSSPGVLQQTEYSGRAVEPIRPDGPGPSNSRTARHYSQRTTYRKEATQPDQSPIAHASSESSDRRPRVSFDGMASVSRVEHPAAHALSMSPPVPAKPAQYLRTGMKMGESSTQALGPPVPPKPGNQTQPNEAVETGAPSGIGGRIRRLSMRVRKGSLARDDRMEAEEPSRVYAHHRPSVEREERNVAPQVARAPTPPAVVDRERALDGGGSAMPVRRPSKLTKRNKLAKPRG